MLWAPENQDETQNLSSTGADKGQASSGDKPQQSRDEGQPGE